MTGKNSADVRSILESLVSHGAPEKILVDGKPHLGTDKLIVILRNIRAFLVQQGKQGHLVGKIVIIGIVKHFASFPRDLLFFAHHHIHYFPFFSFLLYSSLAPIHCLLFFSSLFPPFFPLLTTTLYSLLMSHSYNLLTRH
jgi:hypothetical protein